MSCHGPAVYSFFNGLAGTNPFFHQVYNRIVEMDMLEIGIVTEWQQMKIDSLVNEAQVWNGVTRNYYTMSQYDLPICRMMDS
jgi:protein arginine N-methyltransferase 2